MDLGITGKTALVTGASAGLGFATALALAAEGAKVAINSRSAANLEKASARIKEKTGFRPAIVVGDLSIEGMAEKVTRDATAELGRIDILVVNAGGPPPGPFLNHSKEAWEKAAHLTLFSAINLSRAVIPDMMKSRWGRIIFITSVAVKQPLENLIISNTLRAGVTGFAKSIANETAPFGITINTVCPGFTDTERLKGLAENISAATGKSVEEAYQSWRATIPAGRLGKPEELAALITFLASEKAAFITGTSIQVDGGSYKGLL
ncbi:Short-chain dehydrogenase/reductase SDR [Candidatus Zixiibacteriota bacterium]|nr:Short-chain dehydrogenase/reductase SDR [candidate division Zixibacteria bacterium]